MFSVYTETKDFITKHIMYEFRKGSFLNRRKEQPESGSGSGAGNGNGAGTGTGTGT